MQRECKPRERSPSFQYKNNSIQIYKENSPHFPKKYESLDLLNKNKGHHEVPPNYTEILNIKPLFKNISTNAETISKLNKINQLN